MLPVIVHNKVASLDGNGLPVAGDGVDYQVINPRARRATRVRRLSDNAELASPTPQRLNTFLAGFGLPQSAIEEIEVIEGETDTEFVNRIVAAHVPVGFDFELLAPGQLPDQRWQPAWRLANRVLAVNLIEARKVRRDELKAERDRLLKEAAELGPLAEAAGAVTTAYVASRNAKDLQALDDAAIQASVDGVNDLAALETHEPAAIASAKSGAVPTPQELAAALRTLAIAGVDRLDTLGRQLRAEAELTRKALNRIQARVDQLVAGIVAQTNYANLRTAAGQLAALGTYTKAEVIQLFKDEITGDA